MNTEAELISSVCEKKDISTLLAQNVDDIFTSHRDIWESLKSYYYKFHAIPEASVLVERHPDFEPVVAKAETGYYLDKLKNEFLTAKLKKAITRGAGMLKEDAASRVLEEMQSEFATLSRFTNNVRDLDVTDIDAAARHFESVKMRSDEMGGVPGILTGLSAIDRMYPTGLAAGNLVVIIGWSGKGKKEDVNKIIPTPIGYRRFGDLAPGDYVFGRDGKPTKVLSTHPQDSKSAYRVEFTDGTSGIFGGEHLWSIYAGSRGQRRDNLITLTTEQVLERGLDGGRGKHREYKAYLPLPQAVEYPVVDLPTEPYTLGALIGDGEFDFLLPDAYMIAHKDARIKLLRGLMDTGGHPENRSSGASFRESDLWLSNKVAELVRSLGGVANVRESEARNGKFEVTLWLPENPFTVPAKRDRYVNKIPMYKAFKSIEPCEDTEMMCISVESADSLYLTSDYTVTHNTFFSAYLACKAWEQGYKPMMVSLEMTPEIMRDRIYTILGSGLFKNSDLMKGNVNIDDIKAWGKKKFDSKNSFVLISNEGNSEVTPATIQGKIDQHKPDIVILDYHQLFNDNRHSDSEVVRNKNISREFKSLAMSNGIPIIDITAATADDISDQDTPPMLSQVAWSKAIEYDADLAIAIHKYSGTDTMEVVCRKNRFGDLFDFALEWDINNGIVVPNYDFIPSDIPK